MLLVGRYEIEQCFKPHVDKIIQVARTQVETKVGLSKVVFCSGGFGSNDYLRERRECFALCYPQYADLTVLHDQLQPSYRAYRYCSPATRARELPEHLVPFTAPISLILTCLTEVPRLYRSALRDTGCSGVYKVEHVGLTAKPSDASC